MPFLFALNKSQKVNMKKVIIQLIVSWLLIVVMLTVSCATAKTEEEDGIVNGVEVIFADENLEAAIREEIGKPEGLILDSDLDGLTYLSAEKRNIIDLTGLETCYNLSSLLLSTFHHWPL